MNKEFWVAIWSWLLTPVGEHSSRHGRRKPLEGGRYRGKHRLRPAPSTMDSPEAGAWFTHAEPGSWLAQHRVNFAQAYAKRVA